jgi:hypothetical protein
VPGDQVLKRRRVDAVMVSMDLPPTRETANQSGTRMVVAHTPSGKQGDTEGNHLFEFALGPQIESGSRI